MSATLFTVFVPGYYGTHIYTRTNRRFMVHYKTNGSNPCAQEYLRSSRRNGIDHKFDNDFRLGMDFPHLNPALR